MRRIIDRAGWAVAGALALAVVAIAARSIQAGPLDPPGPVGSTMRTLGDLVPAWDQTLTSNGCGSQRWTCVLGGAAVLDNETGLVWEKTPLWSGTDTWANAVTTCTSDPVGGRYGWRLPSSEELLSLKDSNIGDLTANAPFTGVATHTFWSSTAATDDDTAARYIAFFPFASNEQVAPKVASNVAGIWCVRGGQSEAQQIPTGLNPWSKKLSSVAADPCNSQRFTCVMDGAGVLDHETGLVWQHDVNFGFSAKSTYDVADGICANAFIGSRGGWRLPTAAELSSMIDQSALPSLPAGHPFLNTLIPPADGYWSSTTAPGGSSYYLGQLSDFTAPFTGGITTTGPGSLEWVWCVRGTSTE